MDYSLYTSLTPESFHTIKPTRVITLNPDFFKYSLDFKVIICSSCALSLLAKSNIKDHLKERHPAYYIQTRSIQDIIKKLESLELTKHSNNQNVPWNTYYFTDLKLYFNTYKCLNCDFITTAYKLIRRHLNKEHSI